MENNQNLTRRIMKRVYGIWFLRQAGPALVLMPFFAIIALWETASEFFWAKIIENFIISLHSGNILSFIGSALYNASAHLVSISIIGFSISLVLILGYKLIRNFTQLTLVRV